MSEIWRQDLVEKATTQQKGPSGPPIEFADQLVRRCLNENMSQRGWAPRPPVEQSKRTRTTHGDGRMGWGGQYVAIFVQSPTPSHTQPFKSSKRYIFLRSLRSSLFFASICILHVYVYICIFIIWVYNTLPKASGPDPHNQRIQCHIRIFGGDFTLLQKRSRRFIRLQRLG